jgi:hypothetical protein
MSDPDRLTSSDLRRIFPGDSEMADRMRRLDWSATDLGPVQSWPENLRVAVRLCSRLASRSCCGGALSSAFSTTTRTCPG